MNKMYKIISFLIQNFQERLIFSYYYYLYSTYGMEVHDNVNRLTESIKINILLIQENFDTYVDKRDSAFKVNIWVMGTASFTTC